METRRVRSWKGFIRVLDELRTRYGIYRRELEDGRVFEVSNRLLFRGQTSQKWPLQTTLERKTSALFHVLKYLHHATKYANEIESFTGTRWKVPDYPELEAELKEKQESFRVVLPAYDYLVYLRHHGFPSPLLDWTESPFIAAYFAYIDTTAHDPAVYCYIERPELVKGGQGGSPMITLKGPYVTTHKRHFAQKAWYTIATKWDATEEKHYFCRHEEVFDRNDKKQDILFKIILPLSERQSVLRHLNDYNINHFTLFQSEDSLIKALSTKEFDISGI